MVKKMAQIGFQNNSPKWFSASFFLDQVIFFDPKEFSGSQIFSKNFFVAQKFSRRNFCKRNTGCSLETVKKYLLIAQARKQPVN